MWPRRRQALEVVAQPGPADTIVENLDADGDFVFMWGNGQLDLTCGECGRVLARSMIALTRVSGLCLVCPSCGSYNRAPALW